MSRARRWAAELVVIAAGVFIGLAAEGWAERRAEEREAREMLAIISADLQADSVTVSETIARLDGVSDALPDFIAALGASPPDMERAWELQPRSGDDMNPKLRFRTGGYTALVSGGRIAALGTEVATSLTTLYEFHYGQVDSTLEIVEFIVNDYFTRQDGIWNAMTREPRPGGDVVGVLNQAAKYRGVVRSVLIPRLEALLGEIGDVRSQLVPEAR